jgi:manganese/zinc/iron transport system permease protein
MTWFALDTWIVVIGVLCAACCALPGAFLVLRRQSMMGDAISHAVLPGLAAAFLLTASRSSLVMFVGAAVVGVVTAALTQWVSSAGKMERSAAMGVVFTTFFAIGLVMIVRAADSVDLDPGCVLYGSLELAPMDTVKLWFTDWHVPRAVVVLAAVLLANVFIMGLMFKEFAISSFDPDLATALGFSARGMNLLLMTLVAITTVAAFESIGSILVIAMLIVPPATARLLTDRLVPMILLAVLIGAGSAAAGHVSAITVPAWFGYEDTLTSGMMAVCAGALFSLAVFFAPNQGVVSNVLGQRALSRRIAAEDALGLLYRCSERGEPTTVEEVVATLCSATGNGAGRARRVVRRLARRGLVACSPASCVLTAEGLRHAQSIIRSHRLWESYLEGEMQIPEGHLHETAMRLEHVTTGEMQRELASRTGDPKRDPQGKPIPPG